MLSQLQPDERNYLHKLASPGELFQRFDDAIRRISNTWDSFIRVYDKEGEPGLADLKRFLEQKAQEASLNTRQVGDRIAAIGQALIDAMNPPYRVDDAEGDPREDPYVQHLLHEQEVWHFRLKRAREFQELQEQRVELLNRFIGRVEQFGDTEKPAFIERFAVDPAKSIRPDLYSDLDMKNMRFEWYGTGVQLARVLHQLRVRGVFGPEPTDSDVMGRAERHVVFEKMKSVRRTLNQIRNDQYPKRDNEPDVTDRIAQHVARVFSDS